METSAVLDLVGQLDAMGTRDITLSANGEPTSHPGFAAIVREIKDKGMTLKVVTNLTLFAPRTAAALARSDHLVVNLGATNDQQYQSIYDPKGHASLAGVVKHLKVLTRLKRQGVPHIKLGFIITKNSFKNIPEALELASLCGADSVRFKFMDPMDFTVPLLLGDEEQQWLRQQLPGLLKQPRKISHNLADILRELSPNACPDVPDEDKHGRCFVGWLVMNINEDGSVTLCCQNDQLIIGHWKEKPLREIWEGDKAQEFRHSAKTRIDFKHPLWHACKTCHYSNPDHYARRVNGAAMAWKT